MPTIVADLIAFGDFLRGARERRGLTLQQISNETKIPWRHLNALEHGDLAEVPTGLYRRAEVRAYARVVGLDQGVALSELDHALEAALPDEPAPPSPEPVPAAGATSSVRRLLATAAFVVMGLLAVSLWRQQSAPADPAESSGGTGTPASTAATLATAPAVSASALVPLATPVDAVVGPGLDQPLEPAIAVDAGLVVISDPGGARVTVNGIGWGVTPVTIRNLPVGDQHVRVVKEGYVSEERVVHLPARRGAATTLAIPLQARPEGPRLPIP